MLFHQEIETPLGSAVLTADTTGLAGFYFSDQRDYPLQLEHPGRQKISNPQAGQYEGEILRQCRVFAHNDNPSAEKRHALHAKLNWERGAIARPPDGISPVPDSITRYFRLATQELDAYFRGRLKRFSVPLCFKGTDFQLKIYLPTSLFPMVSWEVRPVCRLERTGRLVGQSAAIRCLLLCRVIGSWRPTGSSRVMAAAWRVKWRCLSTKVFK